MSRRPLGQALLLLFGLTALAVLFVSAGSAAPAAQPASGTVSVEWFGWSHYRFTSPTGKVILTNPFTSNPDSPIKPEDIEKADLIVVADGHGLANLTLDIVEQRVVDRDLAVPLIGEIDADNVGFDAREQDHPGQQNGEHLENEADHGDQARHE